MNLKALDKPILSKWGLGEVFDLIKISVVVLTVTYIFLLILGFIILKLRGLI